MELVEPSEQYRDSYVEAMREFVAEGTHERYKNFDVGAAEHDFSGVLDEVRDMAAGRNLPPGYVPETYFWLVDKGEYIGRVSIRHFLSDHLLQIGGHIGYDIRPSKRRMGYGSAILQLSLPKAKEMGIEKVLVTCDSTNIASKRIIEKAGAVLENEIEQGEGKPSKLRFWLTPR